MKNLRIIAGYILIIFPPVYGLRLLLDPEVFSISIQPTPLLWLRQHWCW